MSSTDGRKFTGTVLAVLALFGIGGAVVDSYRNRDDVVVHGEIANSRPVEAFETPAGAEGSRKPDPASPESGAPSRETPKAPNDAKVAVGPVKNTDKKTQEPAGSGTDRDEAAISRPAAKVGGTSVATSETSVKVAQVKKSVKDAPEKAETTTVKPVVRKLTFGKLNYDPREGQTGKGDITIEGRAGKGARLRFMLDGNNIGEAVADQGGAFRLKAQRHLEPGAHWLVAEQLDGHNKTVLKAESPFDVAGHAVEKVAQSTGDKKSTTEVKNAGERIGMTQGSESGIGKSGSSTLADASIDSPGGNGTGTGRGVSIKKVDGDNSTPDQPKKKQEAASGGNRQESNRLWDRFADIFRVDPGRKQQPATDSGKAGDKNRAGSEKPPARGLAIESVEFTPGASGGSLAVSGHATAGSRVRLFLGQKKIGEVVAARDGSWSLKKTTAMKPGAHLFRADLVLSSGRVAAEARMQYDLTARTETAKADTGKAETKIADAGTEPSPAQEKGKQAKRRSSPVRSISVRRKTGYRQGHRALARSKKHRRARQRMHRRKVARHRVARKYRRLANIKRYIPGKKNRGRYYAKRRKLYPRSRKTPTHVRVVRGTTLWGYSRHYYGRGKLYPHIRRANRHTIGKAGRIYAGQRLYVPKKKKKWRK